MKWSDKQIETWVGIMLRTGVMLAAAVVLLGGVLLMVQHGQQQPDYAHFHGEPQQLTSVAKIMSGARALNPESLIMLGLLLLIATPVARVGMCVVGFTMERDRLYVAVSAIVLLILLYSLIFHR